MEKSFTVGGNRILLSARQVESSLTGVQPEQTRTHAVEVAGHWYPVKQALEAATGVNRADFISTEARRVFKSLGFPVRP
jgi:hypothetical protein